MCTLGDEFGEIPTDPTKSGSPMAVIFRNPTIWMSWGSFYLQAPHKSYA